MSDTQAMLGYGSVLELAPIETPAAREYVSEVRNFTLPSDTTDQQQVSHMQSPNKTHEFIDGFSDGGELGFAMNYVPGSRSDLLMLAAKGKRKRVYVTFPNGVQISFTGSRQSYEKSAQTESAMEANASFKVSGQAVQTPPTAPRNLEVPTLTIFGETPAIGAVIELVDGIWAGALERKIEWLRADEVDGTYTAITDADALAYVPVAADVGKFLRARVIASNPSFSTSILTVPTAVAVSDPSVED